VVLGSLLYDCVVWGPQFPQKGETIIGTRSGFFTGGKGANQAVQAAKLGAEVFMIGAVGNDAIGKILLSTLSDFDVNVSHVKVHPTLATGSDCIHVDANGDNKIMIAPLANLGIEKSDIEKAFPVIESADIFITQLETNLDAVEYGLRAAQKYKIRTILNPAPATSIVPGFFSLADFITPNETETRFFTGILPVFDNLDTCKSAAHKFKELGAKNIIITLGEKGAYYELEDSQYGLIPAFPVKAIDSTAAGDSFNAAAAVALAQGEPFTDALRFGCAAGAITVTRIGAQVSMGTRLEVADFLKMKNGK
jgi:ribokinase